MSFWFSGQTANNTKKDKDSDIKTIHMNQKNLKIPDDKIESVQKLESEFENNKMNTMKVNNNKINNNKMNTMKVNNNIINNNKMNTMKVNNNKINNMYAKQSNNNLSKEDKELLIKNIYKLSDQLNKLNNKKYNVSKESVISDLEKIENNILNKINKMNNKNNRENNLVQKVEIIVNRRNLSSNMKMNVKKEMIKFLENLYKIEEEREELKDINPDDLRYFVKKVVSIIKRINRTMDGNSSVRKELIKNLIDDIEKDNKFNDVVMKLLEHNNQ